MHPPQHIIAPSDRILITGANGFVGSRVVARLLEHNFTNLRCFARPGGATTALDELARLHPQSRLEILRGNLLSEEDCHKALEAVSLVLHLAAGVGKSFPGCFQNSAVATRNLLEAAVKQGQTKRVVNVSSFAVYSNWGLGRRAVLDEGCPIDQDPVGRFEAYAFGKAAQDRVVAEYSERHGLPCVNVRPGTVYGPGKLGIPGRVGLDTFGVFLHLGGSNPIPLTHVDNCAEAIVLAGVTPGVDGQAFNIVDDDLPTSAAFLKRYKREVRKFRSIYVPYCAFYFFCWLWESYSLWSDGQLAPIFNRKRCATFWKGNHYPNEKMKRLLNWAPVINTEEGLEDFFRRASRELTSNA